MHEIFWSAQGEGANSGKPAVFVRLSGCSIQCSFCDQREAWQDGELTGINVILGNVEGVMRRYPDSMVVITGGEPLEQDISLLVSGLKERRRFVAVETSGCLYQDIQVDWWTVAPKAARDFYIHPKLAARACELKLVVTDKLSLSIVKEIREKISFIPIFLQPQFYDLSKFQRTYHLFEECQRQGIDNIRLGHQLHTVYRIR